VAKALGVGGVFFKSEDPEKLGAWYKRWLGVPVEPPYGANFKPDTMPAGGLTVWAPFSAETTYFQPSAKPFMFNLVVDDLDGALAQVAEGGAEVMEERQDEEYGRFGWFVDPEGNKVELWEPPATTP
jgi:predicted enzyme related to lactoylglutathione lyase